MTINPDLLELLERMFEACPEPILVLGVDFTVVSANRAYLSKVSRARADIIGQSVFDIAPYRYVATAAMELRTSLLEIVADGPGGKQVIEHQSRHTNWPVASADGKINWIVHYCRAEDAVPSVGPLPAVTMGKLMQVVHASGMIIFVQDGNRQFQWVSSSAFGREPAQIIGRKDEDVVPTNICARSAELKDWVLREGKSNEVTLKAVDGARETWWRVRVEPFCDDSGKLAGIISTMVDITAEKGRESEFAKLAAERQRLSDRFSMALRGAKIAVSVQDRQRYFQWASDSSFGSAGVGLAQWSLQKIVGHRDEDVWPSSVQQSIVQLKEAVLATGEAMQEDYQVGTEWVRFRVEPRRNDRDDLIGLITSTTDISEEKRVEREMVHTTALLRAVSDATPDLISVKDRNGRWLFANPSFLAAQKKSWAEVRGKTDLEIYSDRSEAKDYMENDRRVMQTRVAEIVEERSTSDSGTIVYLSTKAPLFDDSGEVIGVVGIATDVTERKREEERRHFLLRELQHRSKNLLAVIQSIARQSIATSNSLSDFEQRFTARLAGLSATHDLLILHDWKGASVSELVQSHVSAQDLADGRYEIDGPNIRLMPSAIQHIGMVLHELTSNAVKYGSLSRPEGQVHIRWFIESRPDGEFFNMRWQEMRGPPVAQTERRGFGRLITERIIASAVDGMAMLDFNSAGVIWTLEMPARWVIRG
jgi:PAS domain S-box-containing protein